jgi:DNA-binding MarR family transcriptional regulator
MSLVTDLGSRRTQLLSFLKNHDDARGITPTKLTKKTRLDKSTVAYHLKNLEESSLVTSVKVGRSKYFDITEHGLEAMEEECEEEIVATCGSCETGYASFEEAKQCCTETKNKERKTGADNE